MSAPGIAPDLTLSNAIQRLFPDCPGLCAIASRVIPDLENQHPAYEPDVGMAPARRREFLAGRACARLALEGAGAPRGPIPVGRAGEPVWPEGFCGSIAHCEGIVAAAVMATDGSRAVGIDAEHWVRSDDRAARIFCSKRELAWIARAAPPPSPLPSWVPVFFCVKEAVFKAQPPEVTPDLGLADYTVGLDAGGRRFFVVETGPDVPGDGLLATAGRFAAHEGHVLAGAVRQFA